MGDADAHRLRQALELYRGELLQEIYDDWCVHERERLRLLALDALQRLMVFHLEREEWPQALGWGQRLLAMEPLHERVHRTVMRCHARIGNRGAALKQYRNCERLLREEFQVQPMQDTIALYEQIRRGPLRSQGNPGSGLDTASGGRRTAEEALRRLRSADRDLVRSRRHLRDGARAIRRADALTGDP